MGAGTRIPAGYNLHRRDNRRTMMHENCGCSDSEIVWHLLAKLERGDITYDKGCYVLAGTPRMKEFIQMAEELELV